MTGRLIVFEGLDGGGKTTLIKKLIERNPEWFYGKAVASNNLFGRFARRHPSTFTFLLDIAILNLTETRRLVNGGKTILQDRYDFSVLSFPGVENYVNQAAVKMLSPLIRKPDGLIYVTVSNNERIRRLKLDADNPYHSYLINNPQAIIERERRYMELYDKFSSPKTIVDTTSGSPEELAINLEDKIKQF
jgi:thymidylate kinase